MYEVGWSMPTIPCLTFTCYHLVFLASYVLEPPDKRKTIKPILLFTWAGASDAIYDTAIDSTG